MDYLKILSWLGVGGVGAIGVALYVLGGAVVMSTLNSVLQLLSPVMSGAKDFMSWYLSNLWEGIKVVMANASTFLVIATIAAVVGYTAMHQTKIIEIEKCTAKIQKEKCLPQLKRKTTSNPPSAPSPQKSEWWDPLGVF